MLRLAAAALSLGLCCFASAFVPGVQLAPLRTLRRPFAPLASAAVDGWTSALDPDTGKTYYYNEAGETTWTPPGRPSTAAGLRAAAYSGPAPESLGDYLIQRAISQQLFYSAQMRNEPMVSWLKKFQGHEHLDSRLRGEGRIGPLGSYELSFDRLAVTPFPEYLKALGTEPDSVIEVSYVKPARRLSARERANPYLNKQAQVVETYEQAIVTKNILTQLLNTASAQVETWAFHFTEVQKNDLERVRRDRQHTKTLPTDEMMMRVELERGGETAYSFFTGDEPMPLYDFDCRACDRFDTLRALSLLLDEVAAIQPENAFEKPYLRSHADVDQGDDQNRGSLIAKRRKRRMEAFTATFVQGDDAARGAAARDAALVFLTEFCDVWAPKLIKGDDRSVIGKEQFRNIPGMKEVRADDVGVDAPVVLEALWEYKDEAAYEVVGGGELVLPRLLGERLREIRAEVAGEAYKTLLEYVAPEIRKARLEYTDYVEEDDDNMGTYERLKWQTQNEGESEAYNHAAIIAEMGGG